MMPQPNTNLKHDGLLTIAIGRSRHDTAWKNKEMLWSDILKRLADPKVTDETFSEYKKMSKKDQDSRKDVGGFVGGALHGGRRKTEAVKWRQLLTLDADHVSGDLWASVEMFFDFNCAMYSTHSHSPERPRLRLVIPLSRPVTPDEYAAISRRITADLGIDQFDDTTYEPQRLMYWPSRAKDGEFIFNYQDERWLNPDQVLSRYEDWRDPSFWPESSRAQQRRQKLADKQGDPLEKPGLVGAFCRTYTITAVIDTFLQEAYEPMGEKRYTYTPGSTAGGLVVYDDDTFAYSHHGTDPISGQLVNAFDLVRLHKFKALDDEAEPGTPVVKLPSYKAMLELAQNDYGVKKVLGEETLARAKEEFEMPEDWVTLLKRNTKGEIESSLSNLVLILRNDPNLQGIAYNAHQGAIVLLDKMPWRKPEEWKGPTWCDDDDSALRVYLEKVYLIYTPTKLHDALTAVSHERSFHPIRDFLNGLPEWDRVPRVNMLLVDYLGADNSAYVRAATRKTFVAAVARVMQPGCKFDYMLVLNGPQGIGKSTLFAKLGGEWFNDSLSLNDTKDKTAAEKLQGYWIMEIGELAGIKKAEVEAVKSFLSRQKDIYRPSYGRRTIEHPRQCIIVGSTNADTGFLRDSTGNRRFWPVVVNGSVTKTPWGLDSDTVNQIWAEALQLWKDGEALYLDDQDAAIEAIEQQKLAMEADERLGMIKDYLDRLLPLNWDERTLNERILYIHGGDFGQEEEGTVQRDKVCISEIWCELFRRDLATIKRHEVDEMHGLIRQIEGWGKYTGNKNGKLKFSIYGSQRAYVRSNSRELPRLPTFLE